MENILIVAISYRIVGATWNKCTISKKLVSSKSMSFRMTIGKVVVTLSILNSNKSTRKDISTEKVIIIAVVEDIAENHNIFFKIFYNHK